MAAGRRTSLASLAGQKVDDVPGKSDPLLLTLPLEKLVPCRFNPRRNFGTDEDLKEFGLKLKKRQLQPAVVVSRAGYLSLWPEEAEHIGAVPYVIANGERRYRGSLAAGLTTLNVVHNEDVAASRADFLDAVLSENNDREDLDPIERAIGIETMVAELGGADKVAAYYGKTKGWVSQQRKLLSLTENLQAAITSGEMPIRVGREIAGLPAAEQAAAWATEQQRRVVAQSTLRLRKAKSADKKTEQLPPQAPATRKQLQTGAADSSTTKQPPAADVFTAVNKTDPPAPPVNSEGEMSSGSSMVPAQSRGFDIDALPWDNPASFFDMLMERMTRAHRTDLANLLLKANRSIDQRM